MSLHVCHDNHIPCPILSYISSHQAPRNATIRAVCSCTLGCVNPDQFAKWTHFRTFLLMKEVPLIRTLPQNFQVEMYSLLKHTVYTDGDYIVKQGDVGDKFYIITDGAADVVQEKFDPENKTTERKTLVRLYEGHFFGEMALVFDEPRVASVFAVGKTSCLYLSKGAFTKALSAEQFQVMMQDVAYQRAEVREKREKKEQAELAAKATLSRITSTTTGSGDSQMTMSSIASIAPLFSRSSTANSSTPRGANPCSGWDSDGGGSDNERNVTTTNKLVKRKLATGQKFINKYIILREIGRGAFGFVYLCKSEEDGQLYAMKSISKSTRKWNMKLTDDIKTEIAVMKSLRHQNVVSLLEVIDDPTAKQIYLVQVGGGSAALLRLCLCLCVMCWQLCMFLCLCAAAADV
jgi:CRP-like cAMP-binding protein